MKLKSLRARLMVAFVSSSVIPLVVAAAVAIPWYSRSIRTEAHRSLSTSSDVAVRLFADEVTGTRDAVQTIADSLADSGAAADGLRAEELRQQTELLGFDNLMWVDSEGVVRVSAKSSVSHRPAWQHLEQAIGSEEATSFASIMPDTEAVAYNLGQGIALRLKQTKGGTAEASEINGALSLVAVAPVEEDGRRVGSVVAISILKNDPALVDAIVEHVGGVATIFQNGVRVATTVRDDEGARAVGTVVSDAVRKQVLEGQQSFRGEALVLGREYLASYEPIRDPAGKTIGMMFVGLDGAPYDKSVQRFSFAMIGLVLLGGLISAAIAWMSSGYMTTPLRVVGEAAHRIAGGDLSAEVKSAGATWYTEAETMAEAFNSMGRGLRDFIRNVSGSADRLAEVSAGIADASSSEAESAGSQASAISEASATVEQLDRSFAVVADGAKRVLAIAEESLDAADRGREAVEEGTTALERLTRNATDVDVAVRELTASAEDIGQVTVVIGSIAEQTKILALNAAIEAARAGQAGKGFAVVAAEIRLLADSVSKSIGRIEELIGSIQKASRELSENASRQAAFSQQSYEDGMRTRDSFDAIYERMDRTADAAREIATAAAQQQAAARQIVLVVQHVSQGVSGTAAAARQLADSSADVRQESESLTKGMKRYRL